MLCFLASFHGVDAGIPRIACSLPYKKFSNAASLAGLYQVLQRGIERIKSDLKQICILSKLWQMAASAHFAWV